MKLSFDKVRNNFVSTIEKNKIKKKDKNPISIDIYFLATNAVEITAKTNNNKYFFTFGQFYDNFDLSIFNKKNILLDRIITNNFTDILSQIEKH
jgi:hypothetical protein